MSFDSRLDVVSFLMPMQRERRPVIYGCVALAFLMFLCFPGSMSQAHGHQEECMASSSIRREALVISKGNEILVERPESPYEKQVWGKDSMGNNEVFYVLEESKQLLYVPNFLNSSIAQELQSFCIEQGRFVRSLIRGTFDNDGQDDSDGSTQENSMRTSESCALVPASTYLSSPRFQVMRDQVNPNHQTARIIREVEVAWEISQRAATLLSWDPHVVEPLQLVRYTSPHAHYKLHHDHGGYYGKQMEHRPWTILVFLNDVSKGGHTHFPKLDLRVAPKGGDAIVWRNVLVQNSPSGGHSEEADPDMVHAGEPPGDTGIEKYAVNIWLGLSSQVDGSSTLAGGSWGTTAETKTQT